MGRSAKLGILILAFAGLSEMNQTSKMEGKRTLLVITVSIIAFCIVVGYAYDYYTVWAFWKISPLFPHFADLRNLTGGAESIAMGHDPLYSNPGDPWGRPMNQPRLVQSLLSIFPINEDQTTGMGILLIALFFIGIFISLKPINNLTALMLAAVIFSPAVVLGIERGNHDLLIFFLVSLALFLSSFPMMSMLVLWFAALIKLFPVFAIAYFVKYRRTTQVILFTSFILSFFIYLIVYRSDWQQVFNATQKWYGVLSYGVQTHTPTLDTHAYIPFIAVVISSLVLYVNSVSTQGPQTGDTHYIDSFRAGAGIYLGTFALGSVWVYRFMFLILVIPQLISWRQDARKSALAIAALISIGISCWSIWARGILPGNTLLVIDEVANWVLWITLFHLFISSMPEIFQHSLLKATRLPRRFLTRSPGQRNRKL